MSLQDIKAGDYVAHRERRGFRNAFVSRRTVDRVTATQIIIGKERYSKRDGYQIGSMGYFRTSIQEWDATEHPRLIEAQSAEIRLSNARYALSEFNWSTLDQAQCDAVLAIIKAKP